MGGAGSIAAVRRRVAALAARARAAATVAAVVGAWVAATGAVARAALPPEYARNERIKTEALAAGDELAFTFGFDDLNRSYKEWSWRAPASRIDAAAREFGLVGKDPDNLRFTPRELRSAMFKEHPTLGVMPDYSKLVARYRPSVKELHERWKAEVTAGSLSKRQSIELLLVFLQDFPYGRPGKTLDNRVIGGLLVPPLVFRNGWADCDSKSLLMATVLSYEPEFQGKLAMVLVPGHALLGIETEAGPYDETYTYQNRVFVVAEPTGLSRTPLGRKNSPYSSVLGIDPIVSVSADLESAAEPGAPPPVAPVSELDLTPRARTDGAGGGGGAASGGEGSSASGGGATGGSGLGGSGSSGSGSGGAVRPLTAADCGRTGILSELKSPSTGIRTQSCFISKGGQILKHGPEVEYDASGAPSVRREYDMGTKRGP